jgi:hypothetical protein
MMLLNQLDFVLPLPHLLLPLHCTSLKYFAWDTASSNICCLAPAHHTLITAGHVLLLECGYCIAECGYLIYLIQAKWE